MAIKIRDVGNIRETIKKQEEERKANTGSGPRYATYIPRRDDGELRVRFLKNPDNNGWISFQQTWNPASNRPVILTDENWDFFIDQKKLRPSTKYYAPALDIKENKVIVVEIPQSLISDILLCADKYGKPEGDLTTFDIDLCKTGYGKDDTVYHAMFGGYADIDIEQHESPDLLKMLESKVAYQEGKAAEDATDQIEDEKVEAKDEAPWDSAPAAPVKKRIIKRKA